MNKRLLTPKELDKIHRRIMHELMEKDKSLGLVEALAEAVGSEETKKQELEAQDAKTLKAVGEYLETKCPHDARFPKADCSLCVWELVGVLKQGRALECES